MKCFKCGADLTDDTKFCSYCGAKIEEIQTTTEPNDSEEITNDVFEEENSEVDYEYIPTPEKRSASNKFKEKISYFWKNLPLFGKIVTVAISLFTLLCSVGFVAGRIFSGIIAVIQIVIIVVAILMKKDIIKAPKPWIPLASVGLSVVLLIPYFSLFSVSTADFAKYDWNEIVLSEFLPEPNSTYGEIEYNSDSNLCLEVKNISPKEFLAYVDDCKNKGFSIDADKTENGYRAFNKEGFELSLEYDETAKTMTINIKAKKEFGVLTWSDSELAKLLPKPKSTVGEIISDSEDSFSVYVGEINIDEFNSYVAECEQMGFSIDSEKTEKEFIAKNEGSFSLNVKYEGNNVIYICVDEPDFTVEYEVECVENLIFSKYDVDIYIDDWEEETLEHGKKETFSTVLSRGSHTFKFVSTEDDSLTGEVKFDILKDEKLKLKISCSSSGISIKTIIGPSSVEDKENPTDYTLDYNDSQSFEQALNNGTKVNGKIVQFNVVEYKPDSSLGINCWSGEHLNFISENELSVSAGDIIIGRVKSEPTKVLGSWQIYYEVLSINGKVVESATTSKSEEENKIAMPKDSADYAGQKATDVEREFKDLGFTNIVFHHVTTTDSNNPDGQVTSVSAANKSFDKNSKFAKDVEIIIYCWKVEKPSTSQIVLPVSGTKLAKDFDSKSESTAYYINVDGTSNKPTLTTWGNAKVTDGVAEYLNYLKSIGFTVTVTNTTNKTPYAGFNTYETNFKVSSADVSWTMYLMIQHEDFVEYELDIDLK